MLQELIQKAYRIGYRIYYPGHYCKEAIIYKWNGNEKSHRVNMYDIPFGLIRVSEILNELESKN